MSEDRLGETKLREQQELAKASRAEQPSGHLVLKIIGGVALAVVATGVIASLHDIRRYIRMVRM
ncbi:MAG TPA: hypothetical protein VJU86_05455 [Pyrinomonadaceae bacterium]|nr:hypothetical protein [Pyrinomonadaceae bacterium]